MSPVQAKAKAKKSGVSSVSRPQSLECKELLDNSTEEPWSSGESIDTYVWCWQKLRETVWAWLRHKRQCQAFSSEKKENAQSTETLKQAKVTPSDGGFRRRLSTTANPIDTDKEFCNMRITDSDYRKSWEFKKDTNPSVSEPRKPTSWCGDCSCLRQWGQQSILDWITKGVWRLASPRILNRLRICSPLLKIWWRTISSEILDSRFLCWTRSSLAHDQVKSWSKAKVRVYSDSVLCLGKMSSGEEAKTN